MSLFARLAEVNCCIKYQDQTIKMSCNFFNGASFLQPLQTAING